MISSMDRHFSTPASEQLLTKTHRLYVTLIVFVPFVALIVAVYWCWNREVRFTDLSVLLFLYALTGFSITAGFHRLFAHHSYKTVKPVKYFLAIFGSMAAQGFFFTWIAEHRIHHRGSDQEGDPHSPHTGNRGTFKGILHAHVGWLFDERIADPIPLVPDLASDPMLAFIDKVWWLWIALGLLIPSAIGWLADGSHGALRGLVWGGLVRIFLLNHVTWSVNSICHMWGQRAFRTNDFSTNMPLIGILAVGEGWHNNHHAFPSSARHGLARGQFDATWILIRGLELLGLAWDVRIPDEHLTNRLKL
jgi:stearoyl-CoA desaturase (delta-9 desaturase)